MLPLSSFRMKAGRLPRRRLALACPPCTSSDRKASVISGSRKARGLKSYSRGNRTLQDGTASSKSCLCTLPWPWMQLQAQVQENSGGAAAWAGQRRRVRLG